MTTWLTGEWANSQHQVTTLRDQTSGVTRGHYLKLSGTAGVIELLHNATANRFENNDLATDGQAVVVWRKPQNETMVCAVGKGTAETTLVDRPTQVMTLEGIALSPDEQWKWQPGRVVIHNLESEVLCVIMR